MTKATTSLNSFTFHTDRRAKESTPVMYKVGKIKKNSSRKSLLPRVTSQKWEMFITSRQDNVKDELSVASSNVQESSTSESSVLFCCNKSIHPARSYHYIHLQSL